MDDFYVHAEGYIYRGDILPGAREASEEEIEQQLNPAQSAEELKTTMLQQIDTWTATAITSGFTSAATGVTAVYDSTEADQQNIMLMLQAAQTADFATHPVYKGQVPIRAVPEGQFSKVVLQHNTSQMQQVVIDMALHIGACKQKGWQLQQAAAEAKTVEELERIAWPE